MNVDTFKQSRIGKAPVTIPKGVEVKVANNKISVKGPKGSLEQEFKDNVKVLVQDGEVRVELSDNNPENRMFSGLVRSLINNMVIGVSEGFERKLEIIGVGYRADMRGSNEIIFNLGYSHPIVYELPASVTSEISKDNKITLRSVDKEVIGRVAAKIRSFRPPEPYKGKGIKYAEEVIVRKAGKTAAK
ncbi:MAG: 50S ribosomal protein L6 [Bradymonadales bacterium]|jgi:large subunit ribosomal protein L6